MLRLSVDPDQPAPQQGVHRRDDGWLVHFDSAKHLHQFRHRDACIQSIQDLAFDRIQLMLDRQGLSQQGCFGFCGYIATQHPGVEKGDGSGAR